MKVKRNLVRHGGVISWTGKRFYAELVFGVIRKARLKAERITDSVVDLRCELVLN